LSYQVRFAKGAKEDLQHLYQFLLEKDLTAAKQAYQAITKALDLPRVYPPRLRWGRLRIPGKTRGKLWVFPMRQ